MRTPDTPQVSIKDDVNTASMAGMYRVYDDDYPKVEIGSFILCAQQDGETWIENTATGEGMGIKNEVLAKELQQIFRKHF